jgi:hypothetical protein
MIIERDFEELALPMGSLPLLRWALGPLSVPYRPDIPTYKLQVNTRSGAYTHAPQPCGTGRYLLAKMRSGVTTCPVTSDPTSLLRRVLALPYVP